MQKCVTVQNSVFSLSSASHRNIFYIEWDIYNWSSQSRVSRVVNWRFQHHYCPSRVYNFIGWILVTPQTLCQTLGQKLKATTSISKKATHCQWLWLQCFWPLTHELIWALSQATPPCWGNVFMRQQSIAPDNMMWRYKMTDRGLHHFLAAVLLSCIRHAIHVSSFFSLSEILSTLPVYGLAWIIIDWEKFGSVVRVVSGIETWN